jgi:gluconate 2-dehydrogenase alpha chain
MGPGQIVKQALSVSSYQTTHVCGGAIMGADPATSALNRYLQSYGNHEADKRSRKIIPF